MPEATTSHSAGSSRPSRGRACMYVWNTFRADARVTREAKALAEDGWDIWVVAIDDPNSPQAFERRDGINIIRVSAGIRKNPGPPAELRNSGKRRVGSRRFFGPLLRIAAIATHWLSFGTTAARLAWAGWKLKADVYHSHDLNTVIPGAISAGLHERPLIYDAHEIHMAGQDRYTAAEMLVWAMIERHFIRRVAGFITTTEMRGEWFIRKYRIPNPVIVHNFAEYRPSRRTSKLHKALGIPASTPIVLYQGSIQAGRGLEQAIHASRWIAPEAVMVFLGAGPLWGKIERMIRELHLEERIRMLPAVPYEHLLSYTASATVGLQCLQDTCFNHRSTGSNKLFEYLMAGVPVVASDFPFIRKVISDTGAGVLVDPHNPEQIARGVNHLLRPENYDTYRRHAGTASKKYNWGCEKEVLRKLYDDIKNKHAGRNWTNRRPSALVVVSS